MKQSLILYGALLFLFFTSILGFNHRINLHNLPSLTSEVSSGKKLTNSYTLVVPNPSTGILNLWCKKDLKNPVFVKALNENGNQMNSFKTLVIEGIENHRFIQLNTLSMQKGEYTIELSDINGESFVRKIFLSK